MRPARCFITLALVATLLAAGAGASAGGPAPRSDAPPGRTATTVRDAAAVVPALRKPQHFAPRPGVVFNTAIGSHASRSAILDKIIAAIHHAPARSTIRIESWNIMSRTAVDALLRAQARGVKLRVLMANTNLVDVPNPGFKRLVAGLKHANLKLPQRRRSYAKTCVLSCRGNRGSAHAKIFLFSQTGEAHDVVMSGSANLTIAGAVNQWNDMYTWVGNRALYRFAVGVHRQMWKDRPVEQQFVHHSTGKDLLGFTPMFGPDHRRGRDPVMGLLDGVRCHGARNTHHRRTVIRASPDAIREARGITIALRLRQLWAQGCDVRIAYTVMGVGITRALNRPTVRGRVPRKHLVQDFDGDGEFDNYFHLKALTINGNWNGDHRAYVTLNGSSNWSSSAEYSDENYAILQRRGPTMKYQRFIDYWYVNFPKTKPLDPATARAVARGEIDRYAKIDLD